MHDFNLVVKSSLQQSYFFKLVKWMYDTRTVDQGIIVKLIIFFLQN